MIKLQVIGHLGKDSLLNDVNGKKVINFSVAHTEKFKNAQGQQQDKTIWVECAYWTDKTGIAPYLKKGVQVFVEGQPEVRQYTTKDGTQGSSLSLRVGNIQLLGGGNNDQQQTQQTASYQQPQQSNNYSQLVSNSFSQPTADDSDLPF